MPPAFAMPYLRYAKLHVLRAQATALLMDPRRKPGDRPPCFIVGCGRSGTTILGKVFTEHPDVTYFREPYHFWRKIDSRADVTGLHGSAVKARYFLDAEDRTDVAQHRFDKLIAGAAHPGTRVIEKTPHNVARIGWLESLTENTSYVHIVRNGLSVAKSIDRLATNQPYRMAFKGNYNQWWGVDGAKWTHLSREGKARGCFPDEVDRLQSHPQRGAYEWVASLREADVWREKLGDRMIEVTYSDFTSDPNGVLQRICTHFGIGFPEPWRSQAVDMVRAEESPGDFSVDLPPGLAAAFNAFQDRYQFEGHAGIEGRE